jgi:protein-disulfide isomerase
MAQLAAEASRCAGDQGKFWEYHDALYSLTKFDREILMEQASKVGVEAKPFEACLAGGKYKAQIDQDMEEAARAGASGTPAFFINGIFISGAQPASAFEKIIDEELAAAKRNPIKN